MVGQKDQQRSGVDTAERRRNMKTFTFLCVRADGGVPAMELSLWPDEDAARHRADQLLTEHTSCDAVEIWDDDALYAQVNRGGGDLHA